jgi:ribosomal protein S27E
MGKKLQTNEYGHKISNRKCPRCNVKGVTLNPNCKCVYCENCGGTVCRSKGHGIPIPKINHRLNRIKQMLKLK